jgi:cephalosporin hydroxylase
MDPIARFESERAKSIQDAGADAEFARLSRAWFEKSVEHKYPYNFTWMGIPIIQYPQDIVAMQELIWRAKPDLILETGVAHGGSLVFYASMLELLGGEGRVIGIDIDIRAHNRGRLEEHPMSRRIALLEGSSVSPALVVRARALARGAENPLVVLDSLHTREHVLGELRAYAPLVKVGGYIAVFDTVVEDMPKGAYPGRPWGPGDNPKTAVREFVRENPDFVIDNTWDEKLLLTTCPDGFLRRVR